MSENKNDIGLIYFDDGSVESIANYTCDDGVMLFEGVGGHFYKYKPTNKDRQGRFYERKLLITNVNGDGTCDYDISWVRCEIEYLKLK